MLVPIRFEIDGEAQVSRAFLTSADKADDLTQPLEHIGGLILQAVGSQFDSEGAHGNGARWTSLSPAYARWKAKHFPGKPILQASGEMRSNMTSPHMIRVTSRQLVYEPTDPKAIHHQRGGGHLPQRKIVSLTGVERRQWDRVFLTWLRSLEGRATWPPTL